MLNGKLTVVANHAGLQSCNSGALGWNKRATGHVANHGGFEQGLGRGCLPEVLGLIEE